MDSKDWQRRMIGIAPKTSGKLFGIVGDNGRCLRKVAIDEFRIAPEDYRSKEKEDCERRTDSARSSFRIYHCFVEEMSFHSSFVFVGSRADRNGGPKTEVFVTAGGRKKKRTSSRNEFRITVRCSCKCSVSCG